MGEPRWVTELRERDGMRLVWAWGVGEARLEPGPASFGWRDDGTFVALQSRRGYLRWVEIDTRSGGVATRRLSEAASAALLLPGARGALVRKDPDLCAVDLVSGRAIGAAPCVGPSAHVFVAVTRDGRTLLARSAGGVSAGDASGLMLWTARGELRVLPRSWVPATFTDDGREVLAVRADGRVHWFEAATLVEKGAFGFAPAGAWVSPDLRAVVARGDAGLACIVRGGGAPRGADGAAGWVDALAFDRGGGRLAVGTQGGLEVRDVETGDVQWVLEGHSGSVRAACFGPSGRELFSLGADAVLIRWDITTGMEVERVELGARGDAVEMRVSPDGGRLAVLARGGEGELVTVRVGGRLDVEPRRRRATHLCFAFDERGDLLVAEADFLGGSQRVWRLGRDGETLLGERAWPPFGTGAGVFSPDGRLLLTCRLPSEPSPTGFPFGSSLLDVATLATLRVFDEPLRDGTLHLGSRHLTATRALREGGTVTRWELATGRHLDEVELAEALGYAPAAVSLDDRRLAVALDSGAVLVFEDPSVSA